MERLVDVPEQVADLGQANCLLLVCAVAELGHVLVHGPDRIVLAWRRLVLVF
jgi:hypothetical protein